MKRILSLLLSLMLVAGLLAGCGGSASDSAQSAPGYGAEMDYSPNEKTESASDSLTSSTELENLAGDDRKLIKTVYLTAETETFDALMDELGGKITQLGGYIESRETSSGHRQRSTMVIRIPASALAGFVEHVNANANVTSSSETAQDVTLEYVDTEAKITALETEQARLLELLAEAETLEDILTIEERLSDVTYELERYASRLRTLSNQVEYATVHLTVYGVEVLTPKEEPTVWQRISTGFRETLEELGDGMTDLFVWVVVESPYILIFGVLIGLIVLAFRKARGHRRPRKAKNPPEETAE